MSRHRFVFSFSSCPVHNIHFLFIFYLPMEGEMRQGQVRSHCLLRICLVIGTLLLLQRRRFLCGIFFVFVVLLRMLRILVNGCRRRADWASQQTIVMMRMIGDQQRTAVHSDNGKSTVSFYFRSLIFEQHVFFETNFKWISIVKRKMAALKV